MATAAAQFKIMPESLEISLEEVLKKAKEIIEQKNGVFSHSEEQPIAFGLKALIVSLAYPESSEIEELENSLKEMSGISSVEMIDYRRALG
jgi:elongation factor 1-beta